MGIDKHGLVWYNGTMWTNAKYANRQPFTSTPPNVGEQHKGEA
jgi:hypothetical protein